MQQMCPVPITDDSISYLFYYTVDNVLGAHTGREPIAQQLLRSVNRMGIIGRELRYIFSKEKKRRKKVHGLTISLFLRLHYRCAT